MALLMKYKDLRMETLAAFFTYDADRNFEITE